MKIEGSIEEMISNLFQNCDVYFEDVKYVNCDPEPVLSGNRRSRYEQFHSIHSNCARKNRRCPRRSREPSRVPLKELTRVFKKSKKLRRLTREHISKNIPKSSKMHDYTRVHVLYDVSTLRERTRTRKYRSKTKSCNGRERYKNPPIRETYKYKRKAGETNRRVEVEYLQTDQMFSEIVIIG